MKDLSIKVLDKFDQAYRRNEQNKMLENAIIHVGLKDACLNMEALKAARNVFSIELPKSKIYNQENSERCWIFAGINLIKNNVAKNLNVEESEYALSVNYLAFLDKLEKANTAYNQVIDQENFDFDAEIKKDYLKSGVYEGGYFGYFRALVDKYGIVPEMVMPDVSNGKDSAELTRLLSDKIKKDLLKLIELKKEKASAAKIDTAKDKMMQKNFTILAKCLGEPPLVFDYEYKDKEGRCVKLTNMTPVAFAKQFLTLKLDNYVELANVPMYNKEYEKMYRRKFSENIYQHGQVDFLNMPIEALKEAAIKQLRSGVPVYVGMEMKKMRDNDRGILDAKLYNYYEIFGLEPLTKSEALSTWAMEFQHAMLITGVHLEDEKPIRWKVEDSYGDKVHKDGYYIMNDNFFDEYVLEVVVDKKNLTVAQRELLKQEPIEYDCDEPF